MKEQIEELCRAGKPVSAVAAELDLSEYGVRKLVTEYWPETNGRWTELRKSFGLHPWGNVIDYFPPRYVVAVRNAD